MKLHLAALSLGAALRPDCSVRDARPAGRRTRVRRVAQRLVRGVRHLGASVARRPMGDSRRPNPRPAARSRGPSLPPRAASQGDLAHGAPPLSRLPLEGSNLDYLIQSRAQRVCLEDTMSVSGCPPSIGARRLGGQCPDWSGETLVKCL